jgi:hypothetical protein
MGSHEHTQLKWKVTLWDEYWKCELGFRMVFSLFGYVDRSSHLLTYCLDLGRKSTFESSMRGSLDLLSFGFVFSVWTAKCVLGIILTCSSGLAVSRLSPKFSNGGSSWWPSFGAWWPNYDAVLEGSLDQCYVVVGYLWCVVSWGGWIYNNL